MFTSVSFLSFSFISHMIFIISFLLLTLGYFCFCSSFSSCFRCYIVIRCFSCFLREDCIVTKFFLELLLLHHIGFESSCFHCHLFLEIFLISLLISSVIFWLFRNILFNLHMFVFFYSFFSCN